MGFLLGAALAGLGSRRSLRSWTALSGFRHHPVVADDLEEWARSIGEDSEDEEWQDFHAAVFRQLADNHAALANELAERFVRRFLQNANLSRSRHREALDMLVLEEGTTPQGRSVLRVTFPFTGSTTTLDWDGSAEDAEASIDALTDTLAYDIEGDQDMVGPTGWEAEFDE